jgi:hypothetical protein
VNDRAVLIYGPRKAGTTLLQRLLDGSDLYVYPTELKIKRLCVGPMIEPITNLEQYLGTNRLAQEDIDGFDRVRFVDGLTRRLSGAASCRDVVLAEIKAAIESSPPGEWSGWAVKEVGGDFRDILRRWKDMFPDSRVVVIVRNPFFVSRSIFRERRRLGKRLGIGWKIRQILQPWMVLEAIGLQMGRDDVHVVYYEDLVSDTEGQMRVLARFLGIPFVPALTYPTLFKEPTIVRTASRQEKRVFREQRRFWDGLDPIETALLTVIGGLMFLRSWLGRGTRLEQGSVRLAPVFPRAAPRF